MVEVTSDLLQRLSIGLDELKEEALERYPRVDAASDLWCFMAVSLTLCGIGWGLCIVAWSWWSVFGVCALALGKFSRWILAHHLCHRAYDQVQGLPTALRSDRFGQRGWAWLLWVDWMPTQAWCYEHNVRHHSYTNQPHQDPDFVEEKSEWLRDLPIVIPLKVLILGLGACVWKPLYYGPNTLLELAHHHRKSVDSSLPSTIYSWAAWSPVNAHFWRVLCQSWLPYLLLNVVVPVSMCVMVFGWAQGIQTFLYLLIAEVLTNLYSFVMIVPNHAGDDLYKFADKSTGRGEYYLRQIVSSCDYHTGGFVVDFLHGYLNYQIEHHLWPQLTMSHYRWLQPKVRALCIELGIPYVQEPVWRRMIQLTRVSVGLSDAPQLSTRF